MKTIGSKFADAMDGAKWEIQDPQLDLSYIMKDSPIKSNPNTARKSLPPRLMEFAKQCGIKYICVKDTPPEDEEDSYDFGRFSMSFHYQDDSDFTAIRQTLPDSTFTITRSAVDSIRDDIVCPHSGFTISGIKQQPLLPPNKLNEYAGLKHVLLSANHSYHTDESAISDWSKKTYFANVNLCNSHEIETSMASHPTCSGIDNALIEQIHYEELVISKLECWVASGLSRGLNDELRAIMAGKVIHPELPKDAMFLIGEECNIPALSRSRFNHRRYRIDWDAAMAFNHDLLQHTVTVQSYPQSSVYLTEDDDVSDASYVNYHWLENERVTVANTLAPESVKQHFWPLLALCRDIAYDNFKSSFGKLPDGNGTQLMPALIELTKNDSFSGSNAEDNIRSGNWWSALFHQISHLHELESELLRTEISLAELKGKLTNDT